MLGGFGQVRALSVVPGLCSSARKVAGTAAEQAGSWFWRSGTSGTSSLRPPLSCQGCWWPRLSWTLLAGNGTPFRVRLLLGL